MKISEIVKELELFAPLAYQESYDNAGLILGDANKEIEAVLITLDVTEEVIDEAIKKKAGLILSHHPIAMSGVKKITGRNSTERIIIKAIKNDIAIYAGHTNVDSVVGGVSFKIAEQLGLKNAKILSPISDDFVKLVYFVPTEHANQTRDAIFEAGAGHIGEYDNCSYNTEGFGTFRAGDKANPFVGNKGETHQEAEIRIETILPKHKTTQVVSALLNSHPYEEVAYDIYPLKNKNNNVGFGVIGDLEETIDEMEFLKSLKTNLKAECVRHTSLLGKEIKRVAVCGGSGSFLLNDAKRQKADILISGDFKYHQFFDAEDKILIADIGHFETEQFTKDLFYELLQKKFPNFAIYLTENNSNPINYL